jgi:hypothetical protein
MRQCRVRGCQFLCQNTFIEFSTFGLYGLVWGRDGRTAPIIRAPIGMMLLISRGENSVMSGVESHGIIVN